MRLAVVPAFLLAACASTAPVVTVAPVSPPPIVAIDPPRPPEPTKAPSGMQWMYGSGEGAATSIQTYRAFTDHVLAAKRKRPTDSVVVANGDLTMGRYEPCGKKPLAVILDVIAVVAGVGLTLAMGQPIFLAFGLILAIAPWASVIDDAERRR